MKKLLLDEPPLMLLPTLATLIGLNEAIFLQQLHYWLQKSSTLFEGKRWVYKSIKEWEKEFPFWSNSTIKRVINSLKKMGILTVKKLSKKQREMVNFYAIEYEKLARFNLNLRGVQSEQMESINMNHTVGQSEPMGEVNMNQNLGQSEPMAKVKMTQCIYNENQRDYIQENTTETTTESTQRRASALRTEAWLTHKWNDFASKNSLNQITSLTKNRKEKLQARLKNGEFEKLFEKALDEIEKSQYLLGAKGWKVTFDWLIKNDENILKVVEGNYRDGEKPNPYADSLLNNLPKNYVVEDW